jgi:uncharacterized protein YbjT (DUF2867 family)
MNDKPILIVGGTGKTGRRVADRLQSKGAAVRIGSRTATPAFDWEKPATWLPALEGASSAYITYYPDLSMPGAPEAIGALARLAVENGVHRLVLLSGRGEPEAQRSEDVLKASGADWTILRCSWFAQNFSEGILLDALLAGEVSLPVGDVGEPFVDVDDIADAAVAALTQPGHSGKLYELTGPRLLTFAEAVAEIAQASGRDVRYVEIPVADFAAALAGFGLPDDQQAMIVELFTEVLDGRNQYVSDGVEQALGRKARDFSDYVRDTAASGVWAAPD